MAKQPKRPTLSPQEGQYMQLGLQLAFSMLLPILGGYWLDNYVQTAPTFLIIGVVVAMIALFGSLYKTYKHFGNSDQQSTKTKEHP